MHFLAIVFQEKKEKGVRQRDPVQINHHAVGYLIRDLFGWVTFLLHLLLDAVDYRIFLPLLLGLLVVVLLFFGFCSGSVVSSVFFTSQFRRTCRSFQLLLRNPGCDE